MAFQRVFKLVLGRKVSNKFACVFNFLENLGRGKVQKTFFFQTIKGSILLDAYNLTEKLYIV